MFAWSLSSTFVRPSTSPLRKNACQNRTEHRQSAKRCPLVASLSVGSSLPAQSTFWEAVKDLLGGSQEQTATLQLGPEPCSKILAALDLPSVVDSVPKVRCEPTFALRRYKIRANSLMDELEKLEADSRAQTAGEIEFDPVTLQKVYAAETELSETVASIESLELDLAKGEPSPKTSVMISQPADQLDSLVLKRNGTPVEGSHRFPDAERASLSSDIETRVRRWLDELVVPQSLCPFTTSSKEAATGLRQQGVESGPIEYPVSFATSIESALADLHSTASWLLSEPETSVSTVLLSFPGLTSLEAFYEFSLVLSELIRTTGTTADFGLVFFHPDYTRDAGNLPNRPISGHLPPKAFLRAYLDKHTDGDDSAAGKSADDILFASDFARRAPVPLVNILRTSQVGAAEQLSLKEKIYARNSRRLAGFGADKASSLLDELRQ